MHAGRRVGLAAGLGGGLVLLAGLAAVAGLSATGATVGIACVVATLVLLDRALARSGATRLGPANAVTLTRATLAAGVSALVAAGPVHGAARVAVVALATTGLVLDAVDGKVARRTGTVTRVGARFDGEVDAFLLLALSVLAARSVGAWVLAIGVMRYAFLAGGVLPWLRGRLPPRPWRRVVCAVQGIALTVAVAGVLPPRPAAAALVLALALLVESFGQDVRWLWRQRAEAGERRGVRRVAARAALVAAPVVVWAALVVPDRLSDVRLSTFLRVPVEALVVVAVAVALPGRVRRPVAVLGGLALSWLTLVRALDMGFHAALDRPFDPVSDWYLLGPGLGAAEDSIGRTDALLVVALAVALAVGAVLVVTASTVGAVRLAARHRRSALTSGAALAAVWALCAGLALTAGSGTPVAAASTADALSAQVRAVRSSLRDQKAFHGTVVAADPVAVTPRTELLGRLRGKDVLLVFVESYGRVAVEGSPESVPVAAQLQAATDTLRAQGLSASSAFLTSPTFGGGSWLAHATLQSGLWVDGQQRYDQLVASGRPTLTDAFRRAGWRTVVDIPSSPSPWPEGQSLYHFDQMYGTDDVGYTGPRFSYAKIPDQYTLEALYRRELAPQPRAPVMAEIDLVSSHTPWAPLPSMVPWDQLGTGDVFRSQPALGRTAGELLRDRALIPAAYGQSIQYSLSAMVSFLTERDKDLVVVMLGDHQPNTTVTGEGASHDVPVSVIARDPAVTAALASWQWQDGLLPGPTAPVWRMDAFRDRFLDAFGALVTPPAAAR